MSNDIDIEGDGWCIDGDGCCPDCGGDGFATYSDHPETWQEDCPSAADHWIECPNCGGSGLLDDCKYG